MTRRFAWVIACILLLAACAEGSGEIASTSTTSPTTTTVATTTTTADPCEGEPFSIDNRGGRLTAGCEYRTEAFPFPISITVDEGNWLNIPIADPRVVLIGLDESGSGSADANLVFLALQGGDAVESLENALGVVEAAAATPSEIAERPVMRVGGSEALSVDISTGEEAGIAPDQSECTPGATVVWEPADWGFQLLGTAVGLPPRDFGIPACARSRLWVTEFEERVITIVASARDQDRFDTLMSAFDDFLQSNVTFGDADG